MVELLAVLGEDVTFCFGLASSVVGVPESSSPCVFVSTLSVPPSSETEMLVFQVVCRLVGAAVVAAVFGGGVGGGGGGGVVGGMGLFGSGIHSNEGVFHCR